MGLEGKAWGADLPKSPVRLNPQFKGVQPIDVILTSVSRKSKRESKGFHS
jgi:hypothetical protein